MYADLGANLALNTPSVFGNTLARTLIQKYQTRTTPTPWTTVNTTPATFAPRLPVTRTPTPVLRPVTTKPVALPTPILKPVVSTTATKPSQTTVLVSGGASPTSLSPVIADETEGMSNAFSFSKSPLPLIAIGLAALFVFTKKGR